MAFELIYTSAPRGIRQGSSGFCVVACTQGMGAGMIAKLETLSAYKPVFPHYDPDAWKNPVSCSHCVAGCGGESRHVLSRICFNGLDYTKRSNKLASHIVLNSGELEVLASGPAAPFFQPGLFRGESWRIESGLFPRQADILPSDLPAGKCSAWERLAGDGGWGAVPAEHFLASPQGVVCVLFDPLRHENLIELVQESLLLLPREMRWQVTFNTYFTALPAGISCSWRFLVAGAEAERILRRTPGARVIDLTSELPPASGGPLVELARTGVPARVPVAYPSQPQAAAADESVRKRTHSPDVEVPFRSGFPPRRPTPGRKRSRPVAVGGGVPEEGGPGRRGAIGIFAVILIFLLLAGGVLFGVHSCAAAREFRETDEKLRAEYAHYRAQLSELERLGSIGTEKPPSAEAAAEVEELRRQVREFSGTAADRDALVREIATVEKRFQEELERLKPLTEKCEQAVSRLSDFRLAAELEAFEARSRAHRREAGSVPEETSGADSPAVSLRDELDRIRQSAGGNLNTVREASGRLKESLRRLGEMRETLAEIPLKSPPPPERKPPEKPEPPLIRPEYAWMEAARFLNLARGESVTLSFDIDPAWTLSGVWAEGGISSGNDVNLVSGSGNEVKLTVRQEGRRLTFEVRKGTLPAGSRVRLHFKPEHDLYFYFQPGSSRLSFTGGADLTPEWAASGDLLLEYGGRATPVPDGDWKIALRAGRVLSRFVKLTGASPVFTISGETLEQICPGYLRQAARVKELETAAMRLRKYLAGRIDLPVASVCAEKFGLDTGEFCRLSESLERNGRELEKWTSPAGVLDTGTEARKRREKRRSLELERAGIMRDLQQERGRCAREILAQATMKQLGEVFGANKLFEPFSPGSVESVLGEERAKLAELRAQVLAELKQPEIVLGRNLLPQIKVEFIR